MEGRREEEDIFKKAEQSKDILNKHQDAVEKMVRRWRTDLCVVSDGNGTMEITNNCVVCHRLSCILVTFHSKQFAVSLMLAVRTEALTQQAGKQPMHNVHPQSTGIMQPLV